MRFAVLGTGQVGSALAGKLSALGHDVVLGSRDPAGERAQAVAAKAGARVASYAEAAAHGDWLVNALPGEEAIGILGACDIDGKIMVDIANYNSAVDQPILVPIGEAIQDALPKLRLVKALNSVSAHLMVDPAALGRPHTVFVASNDLSAKAEVVALLQSFGWQDIIDLGPLAEARAMEQLIPLWMALERRFGHPGFNLAVIREDGPAGGA
jgi:predicted dinucleotide-binding enzyme